MGCTVLQTTVIDDCQKHVCIYDFARWCSLNHSLRESMCLQQYSVITVCIQWAATHYSSPDTLNWTLHCVSKNVPPLVCYNFDIREHISHFLAEVSLIKWAIKRFFNVPPQITSASALPGKMEKHENRIFHFNAVSVHCLNSTSCCLIFDCCMTP